MEHIMKAWSQDIDKLLLRHSWLLLFSIPKLLRLSKLLRSDFQLDSLAMKIMEETSFLFNRQVKDSGGVMLAIKVCCYKKSIIFSIALHVFHYSFRIPWKPCEIKC